MLSNLILNEKITSKEISIPEIIVRMPWHQVSQDRIKDRLKTFLSHHSVTNPSDCIFLPRAWLNEYYCTESNFRSKRLKGHSVLSTMTWQFLLYNVTYGTFSKFLGIKCLFRFLLKLISLHLAPSFILGSKDSGVICELSPQSHYIN